MDDSERIWCEPLELRAGGVTRCERGWRLRRSWSENLPDCDLWYVWAGRGRMELRDGRQIDLIPGTCLWMRPGGLYLAEQEESEPLGVTYRHFSLGEQEWSPAEEVFLVREPTFFEMTFRKLSLGLGLGQASSGGPTVSQAQQALFRILLQECLDSLRTDRPPSDQERLILRDMERVWQSPGDAPGVADLARKAGYSEDHYARIFRMVAGQSPREWRVAARMERARRMLLETHHNISEIAGLLGYRDVYFFSRQFREKHGMPPRSWREHHTPSRAERS